METIYCCLRWSPGLQDIMFAYYFTCGCKIHPIHKRASPHCIQLQCPSTRDSWFHSHESFHEWLETTQLQLDPTGASLVPTKLPELPTSNLSSSQPCDQLCRMFPPTCWCFLPTFPPCDQLARVFDTSIIPTSSHQGVCRQHGESRVVKRQKRVLGRHQGCLQTTWKSRQATKACLQTTW